MAELRYNPLLDDWTMVAKDRQNRPAGSTDRCPFCPGSGRVPDHYQVHVYANDFPVLSLDPDSPDPVADGPYTTEPAYGQCDVILYSEDHDTSLWQLSLDHLEQLVSVWIERQTALEADPGIEYVMIFENRGAAVGATISHPHGQIYAFSRVPMKIQRELDASQKYFQRHQRCLMCDMTVEEQRFQQRLVAESPFFVSYIPFFTDYPYGALITSRAHQSSLLECSSEQRRDLAGLIQRVTAGLDALFDAPMPYMMVIHQRPGQAYPAQEYYHVHIEFYPAWYAPNKVKFRASSEVGAWASANPAKVEVTAPQLRRAIESWEKAGGR